jgi:anti-sigma regulatory factor (Ser/Thr protein kinase)
VERFRIELPAEPSAPRAARHGVRVWLSGAVWPDDAIADVEYAVSEAVSNAVEHAYPPGTTGRVTVDAAVEPAGRHQQVRLVVSDGGRWRPLPSTAEGRRRGLQLIAGCMASVTLRPGGERRPHGTQVVMVSRPVPAR